MSVPSRRQLWARILLVIGVFFTGVATGVATDRLVLRKRVVRVSADAYIGRVLDQLNLTAEQRARADAIIARRSPRSQAILADLSSRLRLVADSVDAELRLILTPAQRVALDSLLRERPRIMLRRKVVGPDGTTIDGAIISGPDTLRRP